MQPEFGTTPPGVWCVILPVVFFMVGTIIWMGHQYLFVSPPHAGTWELPLVGEVLVVEDGAEDEEEDEYGTN